LTGQELKEELKTSKRLVAIDLSTGNAQMQRALDLQSWRAELLRDQQDLTTGPMGRTWGGEFGESDILSIVRK
jgi:hypothetical protein